MSWTMSNELDNDGYFDFGVDANPDKMVEEQGSRLVWKFTNGSFGSPQEAKLKVKFREVMGWGARHVNLFWGMSRELPAGTSRHSITDDIVGTKMPLRVYRSKRYYGFRSEVSLQNGMFQPIDDVEVRSAMHPFDIFAPGYLTEEKTFDFNNPLLLKWGEMTDRFGDNGNDRVAGYKTLGWADAVILFPQSGTSTMFWTQAKTFDGPENFTMANRYFVAWSQIRSMGDHTVYALRFQPLGVHAQGLDASPYAHRVQDFHRRMAYRYTHNPVNGSVRIEAIQTLNADLTIDQVATDGWWAENVSKAKTILLPATPYVALGGVAQPNTHVNIWVKDVGSSSPLVRAIQSSTDRVAQFPNKHPDDLAAVLLTQELDL